MKNNLFTLNFDNTRGILTSLILNDDPEKANFIKDGHGFCEIHPTLWFTRENGVFSKEGEAWELLDFKEGNTSTVATFQRRGIQVCEIFELSENDLTLRIEIKNTNSYPFYFKHEDFSIFAPFADSYDDSLTAQRIRVHTHIAPALENSYITLERMGVSSYNLGILLLSGSILSYSQENCHSSNDRGYFILNVEPFSLLKDETYTLTFAVFRHHGGDDFFRRAKEYKEFVQVRAKGGFVLLDGEDGELSLTAQTEIKTVCATDNSRSLTCFIEEKMVRIPLENLSVGEHTIEYQLNDRRGRAVLFVSPSLDVLQRERAHFIVEHQQCLDPKSPLYGAYLIYDNEEKRQYFSFDWPDHNANRERLSMSVFLIKYLRKTGDKTIEKSLSLFTEFLLRECVDEDTGRAYNNIGKDKTQKRLYNAPWVFLYFAELYLYTGEKRYIDLVFRMVIAYYENGGTGFYPNGIRMSELYRAFQKSGDTEKTARVLSLFDEHITNIMKNGTNYPPHEVNYEQAIVTPAISLMLDKYLLTHDEKYIREAEKHLALLVKFHGNQPDYRLNKVPIRYWDNYWFGKTHSSVYGDTLPHPALAHSAHCFYAYGVVTGKQEWIDYGLQTFRAGYPLFSATGEASSAYVYPARVNGTKGAFFDVFADEQDGFLYLAYKTTEPL